MVDRKLCNLATDKKHQADRHKPSRFEGMSGQLPDAGLAISPLVPAWSWLRKKWRSALQKLFLALAAAGRKLPKYQRLRRAIRMSRLVDEQLERWTKKGPAKEPVVECEVPVEHGATGQDVDLDVVEVPVGLAFECERIRQQLRQKFGCESDAEMVEALLGHFKECEGMVPEEEALLQLPWIDVAALAQLTYWYDRRPRETEDVQDVPKEERNRDAKYGRWTKKIGREKVIYSSVGLKSRVRTRGHLGAKVFRRPAGVDVTRLSTLQRAASLCGHEPLLSLVESTMDSLRPKNVARIAWSEVERHNSKDDLWLLIDGKVYDVTSFLSLHPGGGQLVVDAAAQDATSLFERTHGEGLRCLSDDIASVHMAQGKGSSCLRSSLLGVFAYVLGVLTVVCFDATRVSRREGEGSVEPFETSTTQALRTSDVSEHGSEFRPGSEAEPRTTTGTPVLTTATAGTKDNEDPLPSPELLKSALRVRHPGPHGLKFIHISKTGGTSIEQLGINLPEQLRWGAWDREEYGYQHGAFRFFPATKREKYDWFLVSRNPVDRFVSEYHCGFEGVNYMQSRFHTEKDFNHWIQGRVRQGGTPGGHFITMTDYLDADPNVTQHIVRYENLNADLRFVLGLYNITFKRLRHDNGGGKRMFRKGNVSNETLAYIRAYYAADFVNFGYPLP
ncbi:fadB [Symbiodinium microadriaticum]|nr:fadB [Symbiodinium microadriaticum]